MVSDVSHSPLLYPFLGVIHKASNPMVSFALARYGYNGEGFEIVEDIKDADYAMIPHAYWGLRKKHPDVLKTMVALANQHHKPILIDGSGDQEFPIRIPNSVVLRIGMVRFASLPNELSIPVIAEDLLETECDNVLTLRAKQEKPSLAFSGWAKLPFISYVKATIKAAPYRMLALLNWRYGAYEKGVLVRMAVIRSLTRATRIIPNFIIRSSYSANKKTVQGDMQQVRKEFVENLLHSDYALSIRGDANADTRFYEAISLGRIPVFVDTERVMPFEDVIEYKSFCVYIPFRDRFNIERILADFHASLTPEQFDAMQKKAREVFQNYLRNDAATKHIARALRTRLEHTV